MESISVLRFDVVPEQEEAFLQWYDGVHTPHLLRPGRGFRSVRRYVAEDRKMPPYLASVTSLAEQPRNLIVLEKAPREGSGGPRDESGTRDFERWLPHLRRASLIGYRNVTDEPADAVDGAGLTAAERRNLEAVEIYRVEHTTWNLERLRAVFADEPTVWRGGQAYVGKAEVDKLLVEWATKPRKNMEMQHGRVVLRGDIAAVEWRTTGTQADGTPIDMVGANVYEMENGRIKYLHIYREQ